jgi:hypothetical protein
MIFRYQKLILVLAIAIATLSSWDIARGNASILNNTEFDYGSNITTSGLVFEEYFYEQTNYGESPDTDVISGACIIKLDSNIKLKKRNIEKIHLILPYESMIHCSDLIGHRVEISGIIEKTYTGHHHGDALMEIKKYRILR